MAGKMPLKKENKENEGNRNMSMIVKKTSPEIKKSLIIFKRASNSRLFDNNKKNPFHLSKRRLTKPQLVLEEEISSFDLMNFHFEMSDNLIRLIAISISINDCRIYDEIEGYKKYYNSTIPWENKNFYKEVSTFKTHFIFLFTFFIYDFFKC